MLPQYSKFSSDPLLAGMVKPMQKQPLSARKLSAILLLALLAWLLWPVADTRPEAAPGKFIHLPGGAIHYEQAGSGERTPLILLHGFGASTFSFRHNLVALSDDRFVLALDALGFGFSEKVRDGDYSASAEVTRLKSFMDEMNIERAVLVGSSMGGRNALSFALSYPERVAALVLLNSAGHTTEQGNALLFKIPGAANVLLKIVSSRPVVRSVLRSLFHDPDLVTEEVVDGYRKPLRLPGVPGVLRALTQTTSPPPLLEQLPNISVPALIIWGRYDPLFPVADARKYLALPGAVLLIVEAGHLPHEEKPEVVNEAILQFLQHEGL